MEISLVITHRLGESGVDQRDLAVTIGVTESGVVAIEKRERIEEECRYVPNGDYVGHPDQTKAEL